MFFPNKITKIKENDKVLEIGPGGMPHHRSDVFLELNFESEEEAERQRSLGENFKSEKPVVYYDGKQFPFKDNEFDYIICSHVLEHVPMEGMELFISEMQRVAPRGYLEFPNIFYELICFPEVHLSFLNYRDNTILVMDKGKFRSNWVHKTFHEMFYGNNDKYMFKSVERHKDFYFIGLEWERVNLNYKIVEDYDELVNEQDYLRWKQYFSNLKPPQSEWVKFKRRPIKYFLGRL